MCFTLFHKKHVPARPVQALVAACRIGRIARIPWWPAEHAEACFSHFLAMPSTTSAVPWLGPPLLMQNAARMERCLQLRCIKVHKHHAPFFRGGWGDYMQRGYIALLVPCILPTCTVLMNPSSTSQCWSWMGQGSRLLCEWWGTLTWNRFNKGGQRPIQQVQRLQSQKHYKKNRFI